MVTLKVGRWMVVEATLCSLYVRLGKRDWWLGS